MQAVLNEVNAQTNVAFIPAEVKALNIAQTFSSSRERPLRVLSLGMLKSDSHVDYQLTHDSDGGGVRGLSALYILNDVMKKTAPGKKPCEIFDMIAGTSAGG
jgi:hypothetical protein